MKQTAETIPLPGPSFQSPSRSHPVESSDLISGAHLLDWGRSNFSISRQVRGRERVEPCGPQVPSTKRCEIPRHERSHTFASAGPQESPLLLTIESSTILFLGTSSILRKWCIELVKRNINFLIVLSAETARTFIFLLQRVRQSSNRR